VDMEWESAPVNEKKKKEREKKKNQRSQERTADQYIFAPGCCAIYRPIMCGGKFEEVLAITGVWLLLYMPPQGLFDGLENAGEL